MIGRGLAPKRASLCALRHPRTQEPIDQAVAIWSPGPATYTGEDYLELHVHGGRAVVAAALGALSLLPGFRMAQPGEFSRRALLNGKTDLAALEGLADLIAARTDEQRRQAIAQASGYLSRHVESWREQIIQFLALLEAEIDFPDEGDVPSHASEGVAAGLAALVAELREASADGTRAEIIRDGFVVAIAGPPNAGKSSLLNFLAKRDVAIVTETPGTTRDLIEVRLDLGGREVVLIDTAGIRDTADSIEAEGIRRARETIARAHPTLWLDDSKSGPSTRPGDAVPVRSKIDLGPCAAGEQAIGISVRTGEGIPGLLGLIGAKMRAVAGIAGEVALVTRERHRLALDSATVHLAAASRCSLAVELRAEELRLAARDLDTIIGRVGVEDVLDRLFSQFCIGK
jgi:tRNA modification GTPase